MRRNHVIPPGDDVKSFSSQGGVVVLTQEQARHLFAYDAETGAFVWKVDHGRWGRIKAGAVAGTRHGEGYLICHVGGQPNLVHRLIWLWMMGEWPQEIDHINGVRDDNRWVNLRACTRVQNSYNIRLKRNNSSGHAGVARARSKWRAYIRVDGRQLFLGNFDTKAAAIEARKAASHRHFGEFARAV